MGLIDRIRYNRVRANNQKTVEVEKMDEAKFEKLANNINKFITENKLNTKFLLAAIDRRDRLMASGEKSPQKPILDKLDKLINKLGDINLNVDSNNRDLGNVLANNKCLTPALLGYLINEHNYDMYANRDVNGKTVINKLLTSDKALVRETYLVDKVLEPEFFEDLEKAVGTEKIKFDLSNENDKQSFFSFINYGEHHLKKEVLTKNIENYVKNFVKENKTSEEFMSVLKEYDVPSELLLKIAEKTDLKKTISEKFLKEVKHKEIKESFTDKNLEKVFEVELTPEKISDKQIEKLGKDISYWEKGNVGAIKVYRNLLTKHFNENPRVSIRETFDYYYENHKFSALITSILLDEYMLDPNEQDEKGRTPLHKIMDGNSYAYADFDLLIEAGARLDIKDKDGKTPIYVFTGYEKGKGFLEVYRGKIMYGVYLEHLYDAIEVEKNLSQEGIVDLMFMNMEKEVPGSDTVREYWDDGYDYGYDDMVVPYGGMEHAINFLKKLDNPNMEYKGENLLTYILKNYPFEEVFEPMFDAALELGVNPNFKDIKSKETLFGETLKLYPLVMQETKYNEKGYKNVQKYKYLLDKDLDTTQTDQNGEMYCDKFDFLNIDEHVRDRESYESMYKTIQEQKEEQRVARERLTLSDGGTRGIW